MPTSHARGDAGPRSRASRRPLVLLAAVCVLPAVAPTAIAAAAPTYRLTRSDVALDVNTGILGAWSPLTAQRGTTVDFEGPSDARVLRLADAPGIGGYVAITTELSPKTVITVNAELNLLRQQLRRGKTRSLLAVTGRDGSSYQAGVFRAPAGHLRWAIWTKDPAGGIRNLRVATLARPGSFHKVNLVTRWGGTHARAVLSLDGAPIARTPFLRWKTAGTRVNIGLGRVSKKSETGILLVRSARVSTATPTAIPRPPVATPAPAPGPAADGALPGKEIFRGDFETGNLSQWGGLQRVADDRISVVKSPVRQGSSAARFEVRNGDNPIGYGDRAELQSSTGESEGDERWYSWSTMFAADFPRSGSWQVVTQWHANANGSPPVSFMAENDNLVLRFHRYSAPDQLIDITSVWRGSLRRGQWQDIKIHVKWSGSDSVGFVELWIDNVRQSFDNGTQRRYIRTLYPGVGAYFKQGLYRQSGLAATGIVYHDGLRITSVN